MIVRDVFLTYGKAYLDAFGRRMPANHEKVIRAIIQCRTEALGTIVCACEDCANTYHLFRSCGNRHCPTCQGEKAVNWFNTRMDQLMPVHHFMITCTVPAQFRDFFRSRQRFAYSSLFQATSKTITSLASEPTYFSGDTPGFFGVLHTWGRQMQYHPHIHYLVPGGAFCASDHSWHSSHQAFYLPVRIISAKIKSRFFKLMQRAGLLHLVPAEAWKKNWNVNSQPVGSGARSIRYLSSYVFRTAISNHRIITTENERVLFRYADTKSGLNKTMSLSPFEFIRRFLQHVLPTGFMKIRYYGFLHPSTKIPVKLAVTLLEALFTVRRQKRASTESSSVPCCERCNGIIRFVRFIQPSHTLPAGGFT
jgi:hypothetical protein